MIARIGGGMVVLESVVFCFLVKKDRADGVEEK